MDSELGPEAFVDSRVARVARGSGNDEDAVRGLVSRFITMRDMFGVLGDLMGTSSGGLMSKLPGMGKLKQLNAVRKLAKDPEALQAMMGGQMPAGMPGMPGMGGFLGLPGLGAGPAPVSRKQASQKKNKRKSAKNARKKNRKR